MTPANVFRSTARAGALLAITLGLSACGGGLFGGAAIINVANGTMESYDAKAIQGFDKMDGELHMAPASSNPSLNSGDQPSATVFFGVPQDKAVSFS